MIENKKLYSFIEAKSNKAETSDPVLDAGENHDDTSDFSVDNETTETSSPFPSVLIPQTIVTLLFLILVLLISGNKDSFWANWVRHQIHFAINASTENTFGYISNLSAFKNLKQNLNNLIKLEEISRNISSNKLFFVKDNEFKISIWPVEGNIIKDFGWVENRKSHTYEFNSGLFFESIPGAKVAAIGDGEAEQITNQPDAGLVLTINHGSGWTSVYHNLSSVKVYIGQTVRAGEPIGRTKGRELFLEVKYNGEPVDPSTLINNQKNNATI